MPRYALRTWRPSTRVLLGVAAVALAGRAYARVLVNYFAGDDFIHL